MDASRTSKSVSSPDFVVIYTRMDVPYHLGDDAAYSLAFVARDDDALWEFLSSQEPRAVRVRTLSSEDNTTLALVYTQSDVGDGFDSDWLANCSSGTATLIYTLLSAFEGVTGNTELRHNKAFDLDKLPRAVERLNWRQSVPEVAGTLFSNLVLTHALPNANHRSSLALTSLYLETQDEQATLATDCTRPAVADAVDAFFIDSKRLLTVRRNARQFQMLHEAGVQTVTRKGNVTIHLDEYALDTDNPYAYFAVRHRERSIEFIKEYLHSQNLADLATATDPGKNTFVQALRRS